MDIIYTFRTDTATAVYNLEADGNNNYYVSSGRVLVHNQCSQSLVKTIRNSNNKVNYLKELVKSDKSPSWMKQWLKEGKNPPGY
ncbi:MAG: hypothetical protein RO257_03910 [Candidatus Kapabacteria bacterium]|nr:hypothetical protein [Candidatus Kapabacteria bacterium]